MVLKKWLLRQLPSQTGFLFETVTHRTDVLELDARWEGNTDRLLRFRFVDHVAFLATGEFGMEFYVEERSERGSCFFIAEKSMFRELCINGGNEVGDWKSVKSFVFADTESWFEVLSPTPPEVWLDGELLSDIDLPTSSGG